MALPCSCLSVPSFLITSAALLHSARGVSLSASSGFVRREDQESRLVRVEADGSIHQSVDQDPKQSMVRSTIDDKQSQDVPSPCDRQFLKMKEGVDVCSGAGDPKEIFFKEDCIHASRSLGISMAPNFFLNTYKANPLPYPRGCFVNTSSNLIHFNPEEIDVSGLTFAGRKICMRQIYINGTAGIAKPSSACTGDSKPILTHKDCWDAALCAAGGGACKLQEFQDNVTTYKVQDRPLGCFKDAIGCWGFNYVKSAPSGHVNGTAVCKNVAKD